jgi:PAS domain S-box-containing protein
MRSGAFKIVAIYIALALSWIALSDKLVQALHLYFSPQHLLFINVVKGSVFVLLTGFMLYKLIVRHDRSLIASEKQYRSFFDDNPSPMWIYDSNTLFFTAVNDAAVSHYGYTRDEFRKMKITDIRPSAESEKVIEVVKNLKDAYNYSGVWIHRKKDGQLIDVQITSHRVTSGNKNNIMVSANDVTDLKRLEAEKNEYLVRLEDTLNSISDGFLTIDRNWNIGMVNNMHEVISGYKKQDIVGKNFLELWPKAVSSAFYININKALTEHVVIKFEEYSPTLNKWLRMACFPTKDGVAVYFSDITESKEKDIKLQNALDRYDQAALATEDMLYEFDLAHNKVSYTQSFGYFSAIDMSTAEDPSAAWLARVHEDDLPGLTRSMSETLQKGIGKYQCEYRVDCGDKNYRWVNDQASITYDTEGKPLRMIGAVRDISDLKAKEKSLMEQNTILKDIAWMESHEIRRPLASILGLVELVSSCESDIERHEMLKHLKCSAIELDDVIHKISAQIDQVTKDQAIF